MSYRVAGGVAVITIDNPPVNGLGHAVRTALVDGLERAQRDDGVGAVVLCGASGRFSAGADIREFNTPKSAAEPTLLQVIAAAEASPKPVVAAIAGTCMGGGLELALGCHYRVARRDAKLALPEVKLGLVPGAGGTQRLPRAIGVARALDMIVGGEPVSAHTLGSSALLDAVVDGDVEAQAVAFARAVAAEGRGPKRLRDLAVPATDRALFPAAREQARARHPHRQAPLRCIDAVEAAATLPFEAGLQRERDLFVALLGADESRALRHAFFAERAAARVPDVPADTATRPVARVAVVGAGTMGGGIAMAFANAGLPVALLDAAPEALERGIAAIRSHYDSAVARGRLDPARARERMAAITPARQLDAVAGADLVIEAVFEDLAVKEAVFRQLDAVARPGAILATNTSTLDVDRIAAATRRPGDVLGLHFFSPAHVMKLVEVVRGRGTSKDVLATAMQVARRIGKTAVVAGVCDGFIGNRMLEQYLRQALFLLEAGATPAQVDAALEGFGMAMGPFRMSDLAGNDIGWAIRKRRYVERPQVPYPRVADRLCELGRLGQKSGRGWYRYEEGRREALADPEVDALLAAHRRAVGVHPRAVAPGEIVERCLYALVNEAARILEEGIASRASDVDVVYLAGYGFPRHRGGPLMHADLVGLPLVVAAMERFAADPHGDPAFWSPAPLLARLAREGRGFHG